MNRLSRRERAAIIRALVEGNSLRSVTRISGHSINTVSKLLVEVGAAADAFLDANLRDLPATRIECDEIWAFVGMKQKTLPEDRLNEPGIGNVWTWVAMDPDTKLVCSWLIGDRGAVEATIFLTDLAGRLANRVQLTTDGFHSYIDAMEAAFHGQIDYAMLIKTYGQDPNEERKFSPPVVIDQRVEVISGNPDPFRISTSYVERQNLTMRMGMRRFTRLTNGFSKKIENHAAAIALHFLHMNYARPHKALAKPYPRTPAMAAGLADRIWTCEDIAGLLD